MFSAVVLRSGGQFSRPTASTSNPHRILGDLLRQARLWGMSRDSLFVFSDCPRASSAGRNIIHRNESMVRDSYAVGVLAKVLDDLLGKLSIRTCRGFGPRNAASSRSYQTAT